ncbi:DUF4190 domain-containing protein [Microbacterium terricola]|uniref:DUF4190 domain-containing protein n=1 Tax=Microbacterium terricola TaxID=344163 RepID=A0ABM8DX98_9MICO|nr:DUF4190 domain-containing protein [Microbacterium terricola]UYK39068.1 DUF4190 domain-containing protein [Microbacterium terricola]BDV30222.1 hypothetical protein Microterr_08820 [Microbacterium terricola]
MTDPQNPSGEPTPPPPAYVAPPEPNVYTHPAYPAAPPGAYGQAPVGERPGRTMGIVAFILSFFVQLVALILGIVALVQSRKAGQKNGFAVAAIIISSVLIVVGIIVTIALISFFATQGGDLVNQINACIEDPSGSVVYNGITMSCQELLEQSNP